MPAVKSAHGESYTPFPESMETLDGILEWMIQRQKDGLDFEVALDAIGDGHTEPRAIPVLIGVLDADNSPDTISSVSRCLRRITGIRTSAITDGPWWRRWWEKNKSKYPANVQDIHRAFH